MGDEGRGRMTGSTLPGPRKIFGRWKRCGKRARESTTEVTLIYIFVRGKKNRCKGWVGGIAEADKPPVDKRTN